MNSNFYDVIVIGAGVSGSSAAYELAKAGLKALVLEKEKLPRYKTCGGGVVFKAANLLPFKIENVAQRTFRSAEVVDQENKIKFRMERELTIVYMVMRSEFDHYLLCKAADIGAVVYDQSEVKEIKDNEDAVSVRTDKQTFTSKFIIAADGATGFSMSHFKLNLNILRVPALEAEIFVNDGAFDRFKNTIRFDFGFIPHGYGWVFPKRNHLSIGVAFMKKANQSIQNWFDKYLQLLEIIPGDVLKIEKHGYVIPLSQKKIISNVGRVLFAGDNLGFADPITAEGISFAIETGQLAARSLIQNNFDIKKAEIDYRNKIELVYKEIKAAKFLSRVVYGSSSVRKFIFSHYGKRLCELLTDVIAGKRKYSELVNDPANYLKLVKPKYFLKRN